ncbi:hypothetical protein [Bosea thiooxidans]
MPTGAEGSAGTAAGRRRHDDRGLAVTGELIADRLGAERRRLPAKRFLVGGNMHLDHRFLNLFCQEISDILGPSL